MSICRVSSIFDWYQEDFVADAGSLGAWLAAHAETLGVPAAARSALRDDKLDIDFLEYDWSLNDGGR